MIRIDVSGAIVQAAERRVLNDVQFSADSSEWVAIVGPSGAGKSTLLRVMLGLRELTLGSCRVEGREVRSVANRQRSEWLGWLPQRLVIDEPIAVQEIVASARYRFAEPHHEAIAAARSWLQRIGIEDLAEQHMTTLSGGESQRVALAMALAQDPRILLLDEPSVHLDPARQVELYRFVGDEWRGGRGVICVTHDPNLLHAALAADDPRDLRVVGMAEGRIIFDLPYHAEELADALSELYGIPWHAVDVGPRRLFLAGTPLTT